MKVTFWTNILFVYWDNKGFLKRKELRARTLVYLMTGYKEIGAKHLTLS